MDDAWEYRCEAKAALVQEYGDIDEALNRLGCAGWELVGIENETVVGVGASGYYGAHTQGWTSTTVVYVFKRQKQSGGSQGWKDARRPTPGRVLEHLDG